MAYTTNPKLPRLRARAVEMAWSFFDADTNMKMIVDSGFTILKTANEEDFGSAENHLWVLARKD